MKGRLWWERGGGGGSWTMRGALWAPRHREVVGRALLSCSLIFGSDGGDMAYGFEFDHDRTTIIEIPFDSINKEEVKKYGESFFEFLIENNK